MGGETASRAMDTNLFDHFDAAMAAGTTRLHWTLRAPYSPHDRFDLMVVPRSREWRGDAEALGALARIEAGPRGAPGARGGGRGCGAARGGGRLAPPRRRRGGAARRRAGAGRGGGGRLRRRRRREALRAQLLGRQLDQGDRKSTRLNSSHTDISRLPSS